MSDLFVRNLTPEQSERFTRELNSILAKAPPCPDPYEGGCIGDHCIRCSTREVAALLCLKGVR